MNHQNSSNRSCIKKICGYSLGGQQMEPSTSYILVKPAHQRNTYRKPTKHTKNSNIYALHWSTEKDQFNLANGKSHVSQMKVQKSNEPEYEAPPFSAYAPDYHLLKHLDTFLQKDFKN
ncbi:hypothetical protein TNCV_3992441 [Trichonephila clavipes]|uniref:Uncharacterized protein n=1 Tax=Trichonephila clavipes TaxID=2585209 RepID=A0A8X6VT63_TRICX|nr:hypothetical protein TNCV_3992441 [Trichonephila clavipes]